MFTRQYFIWSQGIMSYGHKAAYNMVKRQYVMWSQGSVSHGYKSVYIYLFVP